MPITLVIAPACVAKNGDTLATGQSPAPNPLNIPAPAWVVKCEPWIRNLLEGDSKKKSVSDLFQFCNRTQKSVRKSVSEKIRHNNSDTDWCPKNYFKRIEHQLSKISFSGLSKRITVVIASKCFA